MPEEELTSLIEKILGEMNLIANEYDLIPKKQAKKGRE